MPAAPVPPKLDELGERSFSFYPPIVNVEHNEWVFRQGTWSEIQVWNPKIGIEVWIPRGYLGEVSPVDHPVTIVGLRRELELKSGSIWPHERRILEMPRGGAPRTANSEPPPPRQHASGAESRIGRLIAVVLVAGVIGCFLVVSLFSGRQSGRSVELRPVLQLDLGLTALDNFHAVTRRLGTPDSDRWLSETGERQYRALTYAKQDLTVILMGAERDRALYIGAKDKDWKNVHAVDLPGGGNTDPILRSVRRF